MSAAHCYAAPALPAAEVLKLIEQFVGRGFALIEALTEARLVRLEAPRLELALRGRAFSNEAEVRWERSGPAADQYAVLVLAENPLALEGGWQHSEFDSTRSSRQALWGRWDRDKHAWVEARIPRPQQYPVEGSQERPLAQLQTVDYRQRGLTRLTRFVGVEATAEKEGNEA